MENLKVYFDTSVISHLLQEDVPEKMEDTRKLWEKFKAGHIEIVPQVEEQFEIGESKKNIVQKYGAD